MQAAGANLPLPDLCIDRAMREARGPMGAFGDPASGLGAGDEPADSGAHLLICSVTPSRSAGALQRRLAFELFKSCDSRRNTNFNWSICSSRSGAHFDSGLPIGDLRGEWCSEARPTDLIRRRSLPTRRQKPSCPRLPMGNSRLRSNTPCGTFTVRTCSPATRC